MKQRSIHAIVILILLIITSVAVGAMLSNFAMVITLASLTAALLQPLYQKLCAITKNKTTFSALITVIIVIAIILVPLSVVTGMFINQGIQISEKIKPLLGTFMADSNAVETLIAKVPFGDVILSYKEEILAKSGEIVRTVSMFFVNKLSSLTFSGIQFLFLLFLYLYSLFFLIRDGKALLEYVMFRIPLPEQNKVRLLDRFVSVTRATVKGTFLIGVIQGVLAGVAMALAGIESALFWSIIMMILSVIPVLGTIIVWLPAGLYLLFTGDTVAGMILLLWCGIVVGNIDNLLRPKFVGQDTGLHELLVLFSTLGGLALFGVAGFLVGPIVAALWVTLWDIYGELFGTYLSSADEQPATVREHRISTPITTRKKVVDPEATNHWLNKEFRRSKKKR